MKKVLLILAVFAAAGLATSAARADDVTAPYGYGGVAVYPVHHHWYGYGHGPVYVRPRVWFPPVVVPVVPPPPVVYPPAYVVPRPYYYGGPAVRFYGPRFSVGVAF